jgi:hypothetical protein
METVYVVTGEHESFRNPGDTTVVVFRYFSEAQRYKLQLEREGYHNVDISESEVIE